MNEKIKEKFKVLKGLIGNTPLVCIEYKYKNKLRKIYAKLEYYNYTGSIKDRVALYILENAYKTKKMDESFEIAEATSGNTGISFSAVGSFLGNKTTIFMPEHMSDERKNLIKSFGANLELVEKENGFTTAVKKCAEYGLEKSKVFLPSQFENNLNTEAHFETTGKEIYKQLLKFGIKTINAFVSGVGTGGTLMGVSKFLKTKNKKLKIFAMEPKSSPTLTTGYKVGSHEIAGISDEFVPDILDLKALDEIILIDDVDAINMSAMLSKAFGLGVGISSGANFVAAVLAQEKYNLSCIATVFADDSKKYLSKNYISRDLTDKNFISNNLEFINFEVIK